MTQPDTTQFKQLVQKLDPHARLLRTWPLKGGVSAQVTALEIEQPIGQTRKLVVRQHGPTDLNHNPNIAADEFKLLQILSSHGLPLPTPYYLDQSREIFPSPCLVLQYIEGETQFAPTNLPDFLLQMATHLRAIHKIDPSIEDLSFLPQQEEICTRRLAQPPTTLDESLYESRVRDTLQSAWPLPHPNKPVLLHGDFWPGNILWQGGQLAAIIDWEDAALGDPLADLANTRLEILWAFGIDAMHTFTQLYKSLTSIDFTNLPYYDLCVALRPASQIAQWAPDPARAKAMLEGLKQFINQALGSTS
jgi:aminoglycoside phosphotransferase (APT) family kinase protein